MTTYTLLAQPYQAYIRSKLASVKPESREWWDLRTELDSTANYKHELVLVSEISPSGLVQVQSTKGGLIKTVPFKALAEIKILELPPLPPHCCCPFQVGDVVEIMFVEMQIISRRQNGNSWEYEAKPIEKHVGYWHMDWYPHSVCQLLAESR